MIPALLRAGIIAEEGLAGYIFNSTFLKPTALFGLAGLDRWSHSLFWGLLLNLFFYVAVSIFTKQTDAETRQTIIFVDSYSPLQLGLSNRPESVDEIEMILSEYIGVAEASKTVESFLRRNGISRASIGNEWLIRLRSEAEIILSGALGPSISSLIFQEGAFLTHDEKINL